jgi:hypothetical protein
MHAHTCARKYSMLLRRVRDVWDLDPSDDGPHNLNLDVQGGVQVHRVLLQLLRLNLRLESSLLWSLLIVGSDTPGQRCNRQRSGVGQTSTRERIFGVEPGSPCRCRAGRQPRRQPQLPSSTLSIIRQADGRSRARLPGMASTYIVAEEGAPSLVRSAGVRTVVLIHAHRGPSRTFVWLSPIASLSARPRRTTTGFQCILHYDCH